MSRTINVDQQPKPCTEHGYKTRGKEVKAVKVHQGDSKREEGKDPNGGHGRTCISPDPPCNPPFWG